MIISNNKRTNIFAILLFALYLSTFSHTIINANTNISFWNINMDEDDVSNYEGLRIVLFFKVSCPGCHNQIITLKEIEAESSYIFNVIILCVDYESSNDTLIEFQEENSLSEYWVIGYSIDSSERLFNVEFVPTTVILDDSGSIVASFSGYVEASTLKQRMDYGISHITESYTSETFTDQGDLLRTFFIIIGVGVSLIVIYFLIKSLRKDQKKALLVTAIIKMKNDEE